MIRHTLLLRFGAETTQRERDAALQSLIALCDRVGEVASFACGPEVDLRARVEGFTHAFAVIFGSPSARAAFRELPDYATILNGLSHADVAVQVAE